jgi:hypothetical protein
MPSTIYWTGATSTDPSVTTNWSTGAVPVTGDTVYIEANPSGTDVNIAASSALSGVTLAALYISASYRGTIGTAASPPTYLQICATLLVIGYGSGQGSPFIALNLGSVQTLALIESSASSSSLSTAGPICLIGTHASNVLNITGGTVSVAANATEVATFATINNGGNLLLGVGCTLTTINNFGGKLTTQSAVTTMNVTAGAVTTLAGAVTTITASGGSLTINSTGTITTLNIEGATVDMTGDPRSKTITTVNGYAGSLNLNNGVKNSITLTNGIATFGAPGVFTVTPWAGSTIKLS